MCASFLLCRCFASFFCIYYIKELTGIVGNFPHKCTLFAPSDCIVSKNECEICESFQHPATICVCVCVYIDMCILMCVYQNLCIIKGFP